MKKKAIVQVSPMRDLVASRLAEIRLTLSEASSLPDIKRILDVAAILADVAQKANIGLEAVNEVQGIRLDAEIKLGHALIQAKRQGELHAGQPEKRIVVDNDNSFKLSDYNISRDLSSRSQAFALNEDYIKAQEAEILSAHKELSVLALFDDLRGLDKRNEKDEIVQALRAQPLPDPEGTFDVIVIDPPWRYTKRSEDQTHRARLPYPDMSTDEIARIPVGDRANTNCILWLWTTNAFLRDAFRLLDEWEFESKTMLTWAKEHMGTGDWLRGKTEHCLLAIRGRPIVVLTNQTTLLSGPLREHSRKPDEFFTLVESLCPGTKLEMFGREKRQGWQIWGAETNKF